MQLHSESKNTSMASKKLETREWENRGKEDEEKKIKRRERKKRRKKITCFLWRFCKQQDNREEISADIAVVRDFQTLALFLV